MSEEYRFLRFEVVGIATIVFVLAELVPILKTASLVVWISDLDASLAFVAGLFLFSLPIGYAEHQIVVNIYRSYKKPRKAFEILEDIVLKAQEAHKNDSEKPFFEKFDAVEKSSFLTSLLDLCIYSNESVAEANIYDRLSGRWSHFYARRAVGRYAPIFSILIWISIVVSGYFLSWPIIFEPARLVSSFIFWVVLFFLCVLLIDRYANKIWLEISYLETSIILASRDEIKKIVNKIVTSMIEHPQYIKQGESYGATLSYKL